MNAPVYKHYDQSALDRQYDLRARHPDFEDYFALWEEESGKVREKLECRTDIAYGDGKLQTLDVFPAANPGAPVQVFIHGGFWKSLDKSYFGFPALPVVEAGGALLSINYELAPAASIDEIVTQCRKAVAWAYRNAESFHGDPERIFVSGHSAGGHLCAMMLGVDWEAEEQLPATLVKGGCSISGVFDLEPLRVSFLNEDIRLDPDSSRRNSPLYRIPPRAIPLIAAVGGGETDEFLRQNGMLATAWRARGFDCDAMTMPGLNHYQIVLELARADSPLTRALLAQMGL